MIVSLHISILSKMSQINYEPMDSYSNFFSVSTVIRRENDLIVIYLLFSFIRVLKYLSLPPVIGPVVVAIIDVSIFCLNILFNIFFFLQTLKALKFLLFIGLFLLILFFFSLSFQLAFGASLYSFRTIPESL